MLQRQRTQFPSACSVYLPHFTMPQPLLPLRPKRPADDQIPEPLRTPAPPLRSPASSAPEVSCSPSAAAPEPLDPQPAVVSHGPLLQTPNAWPSQIAQRSSTMWLLPPHSDQSS